MSDDLKEEGLRLFQQGQRDEALAKFEAAAASYAENGDEGNRGEMLNNIGVIRRMQRDWSAAEAAFREAITVFEEAGDDGRRAQALGNLGDLYAFQGQPEEAAHHYSDGAELLAKSGDHEKQAQLLRALSLLRLRQRRVMQSLLLMEQSLDVRPRLNPFQRLFHVMLRFMLRLMGGQ